MTTRTLAARAAAVSLTAGLVLLGPVHPATAGDDRVERQGSCSDNARWKLKVKTDNGRLEVEGEVDSNQTGQSWKWKIRHNGSVSAKGKASTTGPSGSFTVQRRVVDLQGTDKIVFVARHSGQICRGVVNF